jgi:ribosomal protein S18 acetylase RimI-like enzyme
MTTGFRIVPITPQDRDWVAAFMVAHWGSPQIVSRGQIHHPARLPGFYADRDGARIGLVTYHLSGTACEITSLDSLHEGHGIGSALVDAVEGAARAAGCTRLWLITTNDNTHALRFYQRRGFLLAALHVNALSRSRQLKPEIPLIGMDGIPLRDEIELEKQL